MQKRHGDLDHKAVRRDRSFPRSRSGRKYLAVCVMLLGVSAGVNACSDGVTPMEPPGDVAALSLVGGNAGDGSQPLPYTLPTPINNFDELPLTSTDIPIPDGVSARVLVSGALTYSINAAFAASCPHLVTVFPPSIIPFVAGPAGPVAPNFPAFIGPNGLRVGVHLVSSGGNSFELDMQRTSPELNLPVDVEGVTVGPGTLYVDRLGKVGALANCDPQETPPVFFFSHDVAGTQVLTVEFLSSVTIAASVETVNEGTSFTARDGENELQLEATVTPDDLAEDVVWRIEPLRGHFVNPPLPDGELRGVQQVFTVNVVDPLGEGRWPQAHADALELTPKQLGYRIVASVTDAAGVVHESESVEALQDEIDMVREEYVELRLVEEYGLPVPERHEFTPEVINRGGAFGFNGGDYQVMVFNGDFAGVLNGLADAWVELGLALEPIPESQFGRWQVNNIYRSPVHNRVHLDGVNNSWHQYHCAADIQVFPVRIEGVFGSAAELLAAEIFREEFVELARAQEQPMNVVEYVGHVHVAMAC